MINQYRQHIGDSLKNVSDAEEFEAGVIELLRRDEYRGRNLIHVKGGNDHGVDGYYVDAQEGKVIFTVTAGKDTIGNLDYSLRRYREENRDSEDSFAVCITSQELSSQKRRNLEAKAAEYRFTLKAIYAHNDLVEFFSRPGNTDLAKRILNVTVLPPALSEKPVGLYIDPNKPLRGRDADCDWLNKIEGDCIIFGQPGIGATSFVHDFISSRAYGRGYFLISDSEEHIATEIMGKQPQYLVVDDSPNSEDRLKKLLNLRSAMQINFQIIAITWGMHIAQAFKGVLGITSDNLYRLDRLPRDTMLQIIKDHSIYGPNPLLNEILNQANGRPGLATNICRWVQQNGNQLHKIYEGEIISEQLEAFMGASLDRCSSQLLPIIALNGRAGLTSKALQAIVKNNSFTITPPEVIKSIDLLLDTGLIDRIASQQLVIVMPKAFRHQLIKSKFFNPNGNNILDPYEYVPEGNVAALLEVMIHAGLLGGVVDRNQIYQSIKEQSTGASELLSLYAYFGQNEAKKIMADYPDIVTLQPNSFLQVCPEATLWLLLEKAVNDERALNSSPNHPLRVIEDWCKNTRITPKYLIKRRQMLLKILKEWLSGGKDVTVFVRALIPALTPCLESWNEEPGSGRSFTWRQGFFDAQHMKKLIPEWQEVKPLLSGLPDDSWHYLLDLSEEWTGSHNVLGSLTEAQIKERDQGAKTILKDLAELTVVMPGFQRQLQNIAKGLRYKMNVVVDKEYDALFPKDPDYYKDHEEVTKRQLDNVKRLAKEYAKDQPGKVIERISELSRQANIAQHTWPVYIAALAHELSERVKNLSEWTELSIEQSDDNRFSAAFLDRLHKKYPKKAKPLLLKALQHDYHRLPVIEIILQRKFKNDDLWCEVGKLLESDIFVQTAELLVLRDETDDATTVKLLEHSNAYLAFEIAAAVHHRYEATDIPGGMLAQWRKAVLNYKLDQGQYRPMEGYHLKVILKRDVNLALEYIQKQMESSQQEHYGGLNMFSKDIKEVIDDMSEEQREQLIENLTDNAFSYDSVAILVGSHCKLFRLLFKNKAAKAYRLNPLSDMEGEDWVKFVRVALEYDCEEEDIVHKSIGSYHSWSGSGVSYYRSLQAKYTQGLDSDDPRIVGIAKQCKDQLQKDIDRYQDKENEEDIYGIDGPS